MGSMLNFHIQEGHGAPVAGAPPFRAYDPDTMLIFLAKSCANNSIMWLSAPPSPVGARGAEVFGSSIAASFLDV